MNGPDFGGSMLRQIGFSLLELIVVIVVLGIVAGIGATIVRDGLLGYLRGREVTSADWQGRLALERIARELRNAAPTSGGVVNIANGSCDSNTFAYSTAGSTPISYTISSNTLLRSGVPLASGVAALSFHCLKSDGRTSTVTPSEVYYVTVSMIVATTNTNISYRSTVKPWDF
jgi:prepilin-type N-terminal cleavage/methylation domain-containing protein